MPVHDHQSIICRRCSWLCPTNNIHRDRNQDAAQEPLRTDAAGQENTKNRWHPASCCGFQGSSVHNYDRQDPAESTVDSLYNWSPTARPSRQTESSLRFTIDGFNCFTEGKLQLAKVSYEAASAEGNIIALHNLGVMYLHGQGVQKDYTTARKYFKTCAALGLKESMSQLGYIYLHGRGVRKDLKEAIKWFTRAGEGEDSQAYAQFHLGMIYFLGIGVKRDILEGRHWLERSAHGNYAPALYNLSVILMDGLEGAQKDVKLATSLLKRAAKLGDPFSQNNLGTLYAKGIVVKQDFNKALYLFRVASSKGVSAASFNLGEIYSYGLGVRQDVTAAAKYYLRATTKATNPEAEFNLACLFLTGKGSINQDLNISLGWFEKAAMHGHQGARNNVRVLRSTRPDVTPSSREPLRMPMPPVSPVSPVTPSAEASTTTTTSPQLRSRSSRSKFGARIKKLKFTLIKIF